MADIGTVEIVGRAMSGGSLVCEFFGEGCRALGYDIGEMSKPLFEGNAYICAADKNARALREDV